MDQRDLYAILYREIGFVLRASRHAIAGDKQTVLGCFQPQEILEQWGLIPVEDLGEERVEIRLEKPASPVATWCPQKGQLGDHSLAAPRLLVAIGKTTRIYPQTLCHEHRRLARRDKEKSQTEKELAVDDPAVGGERVAPERVTPKVVFAEPLHVYPGDPARIAHVRATAPRDYVLDRSAPHLY